MRAPLLPVRCLLAMTVLVGVAACGGEDTDVASNGTSPASSTPAATVSPAPSTSPEPMVSASGPGAAPPSAEAVAPSADNVFEIAFAGGQVSGDTGRLQVGVGETVAIRVTSDVADDAHLHGYDVSAPVTAASPAVVSFIASIPGVFELELEELGTQLASLQVS